VISALGHWVSAVDSKGPGFGRLARDSAAECGRNPSDPHPTSWSDTTYAGVRVLGCCCCWSSPSKRAQRPHQFVREMDELHHASKW